MMNTNVVKVDMDRFTTAELRTLVAMVKHMDPDSLLDTKRIDLINEFHRYFAVRS